MNLFCNTAHGLKVLVNLLESTGGVLEFCTVETGSLFYVSFRGYTGEGRTRPISEACVVSTLSTSVQRLRN